MSKLFTTFLEIHKFRNGSISEVITLNAPCSGDELKAEPICCLISSVFGSQFGQEQNKDIWPPDSDQ